ncbi:ubiquitin carboxyl-terminal hydrolase 10, partial [Lecanoromycetidae sp. Uapishka_2]
ERPLRQLPNLETPPSSHPPSEALSTQPTTPSSVAPPQQSTPKITSSGRPNAPITPIVPAIPNIALASRPSQRASVGVAPDATNGVGPSNADHLERAVQTAAEVIHKESEDPPDVSETGPSPPAKSTFKSWAELVRTTGQASASGGSPATLATNSPIPQTNGFAPSKTGSLADALRSYSVKESYENAKIAFLEPRGLVNTGNMCYMNSVLQMLVFCVPFYTFLENVGKQAVHSFKSDTPLMDAMIMFMREFPIIDAAVTVDQLRLRLKDNELEQYGDAFIPEFVLDIDFCQRGHQQDAEEFLGFILEEMHDECSRTMRSGNTRSSSGASTPTNGVASPVSELANGQDGGWLEVGPKQKAAVTRSSGVIATESPVTKIFGGKLRSELRVPGMKTSVTLESYQPLQLDIGAPHVSNIIDALRGLTKPETLHGDFNSPRGPGSTATKQVTIETLPHVLILHLKRFQYDSSGGTQKIWKKVGYPLDLEIPKEVFPQHKRGALLAHGGLPRYRLTGVIYHHGKNANGGHYTTELRRQDGREWIRIDDTIIRRIRSDDVAEGGSEEDPKVLAAALEQHKSDQTQSGNVYEQFAAEEEEQKQAEKGWSQVNGVTSSPALTGKKWSGVANGNMTPTTSSGKMTPVGRSSVKENKVAYILFYQRVSG